MRLEEAMLAKGKGEKRQGRRAGGQPGYDGQREVVSQRVDDPWRPGEREVVQRNVLHDPIEHLYAKGVIGEAQRKAAYEVRRLVEALGLSDAKGVVMDAIRVDGGAARPDVAAHKIDAGHKLRRLVKAMGAEQAAVVIRVAGYGQTLTVIGADFEDGAGRANGGCGLRTRDYMSRLLRSGLMAAAVFLGFASDRERQAHYGPLVGWLGEGARPAIS